MKLWKKAAAAVLAAVMSLTLLTGCSGGGTGIVRDRAKEKQAAELVQAYAKTLAEKNSIENFELPADDSVTDATSAGAAFYIQASELTKDIPDDPDKWTEADKEKVEQATALVAKADNAVEQKLAGKKYVTYRMNCAKDEFGEPMLKTWFSYIESKVKADVEFNLGKVPSAFGVVVAEKGNTTYTSITIVA